jgi:hypothetical protein
MPPIVRAFERNQSNICSAVFLPSVETSMEPTMVELQERRRDKCSIQGLTSNVCPSTYVWVHDVRRSCVRGFERCLHVTLNIPRVLSVRQSPFPHLEPPLAARFQRWPVGGPRARGDASRVDIARVVPASRSLVGLISGLARDRLRGSLLGGAIAGSWRRTCLRLWSRRQFSSQW